MRTYSDKQLVEMTVDDAANELGNNIYQAALFFETLEGTGKIDGNGHHMAQDLAAVAIEMLRRRWRHQLPEQK